VRKREFEVLGEELLDVWALDVLVLLEFDNLEDLFQILSVIGQILRSLRTYVNGPETGSMSGGHILVESLNCISS
jgi:hypothetical protein